MREVAAVVREIRLARERADWSQERLAEEMNVSASLVNKVEGGVVPASPDYVRAAARVLPPDPDIYIRIRDDGMQRPAVSDWLRDWMVIEQQATIIRWFELALIPGLLQTESYAKALTGSDEVTATRMQRRRVLEKDDAPEATFVIHERVLQQPVGGPEVMAEQLAYLTVAPATVLVLPADAETYAGLDGSFVMLTVGDRQYIHVATPARGFTLDDRELVSQVQRHWEALLTEALSRGKSRDLILKAAESWKASSG